MVSDREGSVSVGESLSNVRGAGNTNVREGVSEGGGKGVGFQ